MKNKKKNNLNFKINSNQNMVNDLNFSNDSSNSSTILKDSENINNRIRDNLNFVNNHQNDNPNAKQNWIKREYNPQNNFVNAPNSQNFLQNSNLMSRKNNQLSNLNQNNITQNDNFNITNLANQNLPYNNNNSYLPTTGNSVYVRQNLNTLSVLDFNNIVPKPVSREIRSEKMRSLFMILFGLIGSLTSIFFITLFFLSENNIYILGISNNYIPSPILTFISFIWFGLMFIWGSINFRQILRETKTYINNRKAGYNIVPQFILNNFKRMIRRVIILNWISIPLYILGLIILGILIGLNKYQGQEFTIGFWNLGVLKNLKVEITTLLIILGSLFIIHIFNIILSKTHRNNIISYYGSDIVSHEQIKNISKRTNRICLATFILVMLILFFIITIPILLFKKNKSVLSKFVLPWKIK